MENKNTVSIPLVDILSEMLNERVVMNGDDYVVFSTLKKIEKSTKRWFSILHTQKFTMI